MSFYLQQNKDESKEFLADSFLQPVEHSFTVESLAALLESTGMEIIQQCIDVFDKVAGRLSWNLEFDDETAARNCDALDDLDRWKISNLLMVEKSFSLYFYAQRAESNFKRKSEQGICTDFWRLNGIEGFGYQWRRQHDGLGTGLRDGAEALRRSEKLHLVAELRCGLQKGATIQAYDFLEARRRSLMQTNRSQEFVCSNCSLRLIVRWCSITLWQPRHSA